MDQPDDPTTDLEHIERTIEALFDVETEIIEQTYARLFARSSEAHALFGPNTLGPRAQMVNETLITALDLLRGESWVHEYMTCHGVRHRHSYEVTDAMYDQYAECVLEAIREILGAGFTPALEAAWRRTLERLNAIALEAANGRAAVP